MYIHTPYPYTPTHTHTRIVYLLFVCLADHADFLTMVHQNAIATDAESASNLHRVLALDRTTGEVEEGEGE